jgi:hypothetical protein
MKTNLDTAAERFPALRSPGAMLAARCALEWYELTPERAEATEAFEEYKSEA